MDERVLSDFIEAMWTGHIPDCEDYRASDCDTCPFSYHCPETTIDERKLLLLAAHDRCPEFFI